ncbi:colorectal mutant cancer protein-like isoform X2 [Homarus americanus]|uniref:colorectal mutant cancer protein-like isoform X2 n=1 Tax=Homarus americanus TaxID=6706 RepID=UPI001C472EA7|nr:colorectal mutant cancer protein-like isoform X2 [Homarus americanus]
MSDSGSGESQGSCGCTCDGECGMSLSPASSRRGAESTSGCPSSSDYLPSDPISGSLSPVIDTRTTEPHTVTRRGRHSPPPPLPEKRKPRDPSVQQRRIKMPQAEDPGGVVRPRMMMSSSGCPSPQGRCWWDHQQLSPGSCASGYWEQHQQEDPGGGRGHRTPSPDSGGSEEMEQMKALFNACDTDGDGYITSANLCGMLSMLGLEGSGDTLARELGGDRRGRVSLNAFLASRKHLAHEVNAIRSEGGGSWTPELWSGGSEGGDVDPSLLLQRPPSSLLDVPGPGRRRQGMALSYRRHTSRQVLEATNKLHLAALGSLKGEIMELSSRLKMISQERDMLEKTLTVTQLEKVRVERESEDRLDSQAQRYEERLTELHSVIAELSRKIDQQRINVIAEEEVVVEEYSQSELSHDQHDATDSTSEAVESEEHMEEPRDHTATDASTSCDIDDRAVEMRAADRTISQQAGEGIADLDVSECPRGSGDTSSCRASGDDACRSLSALEEELKVLREENNSLQHALALAQHNTSTHRSTITALTQERDALCKKLREYQRMQPAMPPQALQVADAVTVRGLRGTPLAAFTVTSGGSGLSGSGPGTVSPSPSPQPPESHTPTQDDTPIICRLAERVRLKKAESGDLRITGTDLSSVGVWTTAVAEQLVAGVQEDSDAQELYHALATAGGALAPHERLKEFEVEIERLHAKVDHLKAQNDVLAITLSESKSHCDHLSILMGKYESNSIALQLAVTNLDQTIEAYEVLVALLESEIGLLLASCKAAGVGVKRTGGGAGGGWSYADQDDLVALVKRAQEQRRSTENVARHLLSRLDRSECQQSDTESWNEAGIIHNTSTGSSTSSGVDSDVSRGEEHRLRETINRLKDERGHVSASLLPLESLHVDPLTKHYPLSLNDAHKLDLENAVLMQELTAMREDRAELRAQVYLMEREKAGLELRVGTCEAQAAAYCATIDHLKSELAQGRPGGNQDGEGDGDSGVDSSSPEIMEALRRERQLKGRVQDLVTTLEKVTKNSEARHMQSQEFINDLKKANGALLTAVDRLKKKYALKVKRMEQQMMGMVDRHAHQVRVLKQKISTLEDDPSIRHTQMISTASETSL